MKYVICAFLCLFLIGCQATKQIGGDGNATYSRQTKVISPDGTINETTTTVDATTKQADNASTPATLSLKDNTDGTVLVNIDTGKPRDVDTIKGMFNILNIVTYAGIGLIVIGIAVGFLLKNIQWAVVIGLVGVGMIAGSYLLAQYAIWFMFGLVVILLYGGYLAYSTIKLNQAVVETVDTVDNLLVTGKLNKEELKKIAPITQSTSTRKLINGIKYKSKI